MGRIADPLQLTQARRPPQKSFDDGSQEVDPAVGDACLEQVRKSCRHEAGMQADEVKERTAKHNKQSSRPTDGRSRQPLSCSADACFLRLSPSRPAAVPGD